MEGYSYPIWIQKRGYNYRVCNICRTEIKSNSLRCSFCRNLIYDESELMNIPSVEYREVEEDTIGREEEWLGEEEREDTVKVPMMKIAVDFARSIGVNYG